MASSLRLLIVAVAVMVVASCSGGSDSTDSPTTEPGDQTTTSSSTTTSTTTPTSEQGGTTTRPAPDSVPRAAPGSTTPRSSTTSAPSNTTNTTRPAAAPGAGGGSTSDPPRINSVAPAPFTRYRATYNATDARFGADVPLSALVSDPNGDAVTVEWFSSLDGFLGRGSSIVARLHPDGDASQPTITVRVTDATGAVTETTFQLVVWIPSDQ